MIPTFEHYRHFSFFIPFLGAIVVHTPWLLALPAKQETLIPPDTLW